MSRMQKLAIVTCLILAVVCFGVAAQSNNRADERSLDAISLCANPVQLVDQLACRSAQEDEQYAHGDVRAFTIGGVLFLLAPPGLIWLKRRRDYRTRTLAALEARAR